MPRRKAVTDVTAQKAVRNLTAALLASTLEAASAQAALFVADADDRQCLLSSLDHMRALLRRLFPEVVSDHATNVAHTRDDAPLTSKR